MRESAFIDAMIRMGFHIIDCIMDPVTSMAFKGHGSKLHIIEFSSGKAVAIYNSAIYCRADDLSTLLYVVAAAFYEKRMQDVEEMYLEELADMYKESLAEEY